MSVPLLRLGYAMSGFETGRQFGCGHYDGECQYLRIDNARLRTDNERLRTALSAALKERNGKI